MPKNADLSYDRFLKSLSRDRLLSQSASFQSPTFGEWSTAVESGKISLNTFSHTPEAKERIGAAQRGKVVGLDTRARISKANLGRERSFEVKEEDGRKSRHQWSTSRGMKEREKRSLDMRGKRLLPLDYRHSLESREAIQRALLGNQNPLGNRHSPETRDRISKSVSSNWIQRQTGFLTPGVVPLIYPLGILPVVRTYESFIGLYDSRKFKAGNSRQIRDYLRKQGILSWPPTWDGVTPALGSDYLDNWITADQFWTFVEKQEWTCCFCYRPLTEEHMGPIVVHHSHDTGERLGIAHSICNLLERPYFWVSSLVSV